jgi:hypothetical protein
MTNIPEVLDHYDDNGLLLRRKFGDQPVPPIIKTAADMSAASQKFEDDYALTVDTEYGREFRLPVVDAGNTVASALYFAEYGDQLAPELRKVAAANLKTALESFGFDVPEELTKTATVELGYSGEAETASLEALFGVTADDEMEVVVDAFDSCSPRGKRRMMMRVKEAGAELPDGQADYARDEIGTDLDMGLDLRGLELMDPEANVKLASIRASADGDMTPDQVAEELERFDTEHFITHLYGKRIPDPYATVFGTTLQVKEASPSHVEVDGRSFSAEAIRGFADAQSDTVREQFGEEFAEQFTQDPVAVMHSLPTTHQQALARMI